jgi:N-acetylneuraminate synthase
VNHQAPQIIDLAGRPVGDGQPPYVIAEIGSNHNGDMDLAKRLIAAAKNAGADAVKFQSWSVQSIVGRAEFERNTSYTDKKKHFGSLEEMVRRYQLTPEQHREADAFCRELGIAFLSSAFASDEVDLLDGLDVAAFKVASMDINYLPLLEAIGRKGRPVMIAGGMATLGEIERAIDTLRSAGSGPIIFLHCVSIYPAPPSDIHLRNIPMLRAAFDVPVGFSDHTLGTAIPLASIALGACVIEKHFTLDQSMEGWDHAISADPAELETIVREGRNIHLALGSSKRVIGEAEQEKRKAFRRRIVAKKALPKGHRLHPDDLDFKRPGNGIHPDELRYIVGRPLARDVAPDDELDWSDLA